MKVIGLTGGIGSGKTTVAKVFEELGIPVFNSDKEAKLLYKNDGVKATIFERYGKELNDPQTGVNFKRLSKIIFENKEELAWINSFIHPLVQRKFEVWCSMQNTCFVLKESALLLERENDTSCDWVVTVIANESTRMDRVKYRDGVTSQEVEIRMSKQMLDEERIEKTNFVIDNESSLLLPQILKFLQDINFKSDID